MYKRSLHPLLVLVVHPERDTILVVHEEAAHVLPFPPGAGRNTPVGVGVPGSVTGASTDLYAVYDDRTVLHLGVRPEAVHRAARSPADRTVYEIERLTSDEFLHWHFRLPWREKWLSEPV